MSNSSLLYKSAWNICTCSEWITRFQNVLKLSFRYCHCTGQWTAVVCTYVRCRLWTLNSDQTRLFYSFQIRNPTSNIWIFSDRIPKSVFPSSHNNIPCAATTGSGMPQLRHSSSESSHTKPLTSSRGELWRKFEGDNEFMQMKIRTVNWSSSGSGCSQALVNLGSGTIVLKSRPCKIKEEFVKSIYRHELEKIVLSGQCKDMTASRVKLQVSPKH